MHRSRLPALLPALILMLWMLTPAQAVTLRLCTMESAVLPYITPEGQGTADLLIRMAAQELDITLIYHPAPLARCRELVRTGSADAFPAAPYIPTLAAEFRYPLQRGEIETGDAVASGRTMVFRRVGSSVEWDGVRFAHLSTPVLTPFGTVMPREKLQALNVPIDANGRTMQANFQKMLAGRADVAVALETHGAQLLLLPQFAGKIEMLPAPFLDENYYLAISPAFYEAHAALIEKLWDTIGRLRRSPLYLAQQRKAMEDLLKP
ncbi:hypothetical protein GTP23_05860 [Pseudoduganella sp. FT93W]|uniref:Transporter substrate-binding domain-containing protein n=1 Tax=Duganella fentianensis TaxID=2692177 RepID=A0A845HUB4_9BURK|nr:hypothetical protein [Duganella fentianensis]MYN44600.1 hypothetical protein [Duganella fentianensis]